MLTCRKILRPFLAAALYLGLMVVFTNALQEPLTVTFATNFSVVIFAMLCVNFAPVRTERLTDGLTFSFMLTPAFLGCAAVLALPAQLVAQSAAVWFPFGRTGLVLSADPAVIGFYFTQSILLAPLAEEILFRGVLHGTLRQVISPFSSAIFSSVLFGMAHGSWFNVILMSLIGFYFALVFEFTGSLAVTMLTHVTYNAAVLLTLLLCHGLIVSPVGVWLVILTIAAILLFLWYRLNID